MANHLIQLQSPSWRGISEEKSYFSWHNSWTKEAWWFRLIPLAASPETFTAGAWCLCIWCHHDGCFLLHPYLIVVFGNIPAVSMIMCMKGHNGHSPCCMCEIQGICIPSSPMTMYYAPLHHKNFHDSQHQYNATVLPPQNHTFFMEQAWEI